MLHRPARRSVQLASHLVHHTREGAPPAPASATTTQSPLTISRTVPLKLSCSLALALGGGVQLRHMPA